MFALYILFAILIAGATLLLLAFFATLITCLLAQTFDSIAQAQAATDLAALYRRVLAELQNRRPTHDNPEPPPYLVSICISPLRNPAYLVGLASRKPVWSAKKSDAQMVHNLLAAKAWINTLEQQHGYDAWVVVPVKEGK